MKTEQRGATKATEYVARLDVDGYSPPWDDFASFFESRTDDDRTYLIAVSRTQGTRSEWTVAQWRNAVYNLADEVTRHGVKAGDNVAVLAHNTPETLAFTFAVWLLGACVVPLDPREGDGRHREIMQDCAARWIGVDAGPESIARARRQESVEPIVISGLMSTQRRGRPWIPAKPQTLEAPALRMHTSGTSGRPKAIVIPMRSILLNSDAMKEAFGWTAETRVLTVLPISHANGLLINSFLPWFAGGSTVLVDKFSGSTFWSIASETQATTSSIVPTVLEYLLAAEPGDHGKSVMKEVISGSGPLRATAASEFEQRFGMPVRQLYGLSETTAVLTATRRGPDGFLEPRLRKSIGTAVPHAEVQVLDPNGAPCGPGERGEIVARGGMLMTGYANNDNANTEAFAGDWFHTGDRGYWERGSDGNIWFFLEGRLRESIVRGGLNIAPQLIDEVVANHPLVQSAAAVPFANRWQGEEIAVFVIAKGNLTEPELLAWCAERLEPHMCPKVVIFGTEIPSTTVGKIRRTTLAQQLAGELARYWDTSFRSGKTQESHAPANARQIERPGGPASS
jgi:acyl-CoA synthetase (AMP-forming)/AMP-acid ligase II